MKTVYCLQNLANVLLTDIYMLYIYISAERKVKTEGKCGI